MVEISESSGASAYGSCSSNEQLKSAPLEIMERAGRGIGSRSEASHGVVAGAVNWGSISSRGGDSAAVRTLGLEG